MQIITAAWLKSFDALKGVPLHQLEWFIVNGQTQSLEPDELLFIPGSPVDATYIVYSGLVSMYILQNDEARAYAMAGPGSIHGYLPFSRGKINFGYGRAVEKTFLLSFPVEKVNEMICSHLELTEALVHVLTSRVRDFTTRQQQDEKMMALGKLSAGLAHELNNPAAAILRDARSMEAQLKDARKSFSDLMGIHIEPELIDLINAFIQPLLAEPAKLPLTLKRRTALEDELTNWLISRNIRPAAFIAETLIDSGASLKELIVLIDQIPEANRGGVMKWINNHLLSSRMLNDIISSSQRIVELVGSVKVYTHMDQNRDKQYTDIHEGIRNTLVMLRHKIVNTKTSVIEDFDAALPPVNARAGELNQVWTNLIDNSLDAIAEIHPGVLKITTLRQDDMVHISFIDNGPGIDPALRETIFEPFFTTKGVKQGSGLGLEVVQRVVRQHGGYIRIESVPGRTSFEVSLPVNG
jgi:signal transduction histidine kinase